MCTHLKRRENGRYYIRRRIPLDLVPILGKTEFSKALGTSDYAESVRRCRLEGVRLDAEWAALRAASQAAPVPGSVRVAPPETETDCPRLESPVVVRLKEVDPHQSHPSKPTKTLRDVVPSWIARNGPKENAVGRTEKAITLFEQAVGVVPLADLAKAHGATFVRFLLDQNARGFGRKTAHNHAACITTLLGVAVKDDLIDRNPLDLTFDKSIGAERREPWTNGELSLMFGHALFSDRMGTVEHWQGVKPADGRALLLLLQHTGARIGEIAQLRRGDFQRHGGVITIGITAEAGTVKTAESERTIPLAAHLIADPWFSAWLAAVMGGGRRGDPAFTTLAGRARGPGDTAVQWFLGFRKAAGLPLGALHGSHRFRHWIRSALAAKSVGVETADAITGHAAQGSSGRVSYTTIPLSVMLDALNMVAYPSVSVTQ
jgi:integrase